MPLNELETKQSQLHASIQLMNEQKDEFESIINGKIKSLQQMIHESVNGSSKKIKEDVHAKIDALLERDAPTEENTKALQEINDYILKAFTLVKEEWERNAKEHFKNLLSQYSKRSQSFLNELAKNLSALLNFDFELIANQFDLNIYSSFYLTLDSGMAPVFHQQSLLKSILPNTAKRKLQKQWQQHYNEIVVRNTSAIIYDLQYKIQESFRKFNYDLNNHLEALFNSLDDVLKHTRTKRLDEQQSVAGAIAILNNKLDALQQL